LVARLTGCAEGIDDSTWTGASDLVGIAAKHSNSRAKLGAAKRDHMLADVNGNLLSLMMVGVHQDPLDEVIAVLVASNVDEWDAWTIGMRSGDDSEITFQEFRSTDLQALLDHLGGELVNAVAVRVG
jgi:hypothetical protein